MTRTPVLSIVVPSYNQGTYLRRTLESLVDQADDGCLEIIVQDAHSDDQTAQVLRDFAQLPFLHIYVEADRGQSHAINLGLSKAKGSVFSWLNSDDVILPGAVAAVVEAHLENPHVDFIYGDAWFINEHDMPVRAYPTGEPILEVMKHRCVLSQPSCFFTRKSIERLGGLREELNFCMDYELWLRMLQANIEPLRLDAVLSCTRLHDQTKTSTGGLDFVNEIISMQEDRLGCASPVWRMYQNARSPKLAWVPGKSLRFAAAAALTWYQSVDFARIALHSYRERQRAGRRASNMACKHVP